MVNYKTLKIFLYFGKHGFCQKIVDFYVKTIHFLE